MLPSTYATLMWLLPLTFSSVSGVRSDNANYKYKADISYVNVLQSPVIHSVTSQVADHHYYYSNIDIQLTFHLYFNDTNDYLLNVDTFYFTWGFRHINASDGVFYQCSGSQSLNGNFNQDNLNNLDLSVLFLPYYDGEYDYAYRYVQLYDNGTEIGSLYTFNDTYFDDHFYWPYDYACVYEFDTSYLINNINSYINNITSIDSAYNQGYDDGYNLGYNTGNNQGESDGYEQGHYDGYDEGYSDGYQFGYNAGYSEGATQNETAVAIFSGIISVGLIPINFFLACLNFEVFGINIGSFVSALLTIAIVVIITRMIISGGNGGGDK